tara:strand:+ start:354 stop:614 length:261 start_codon:yes stop_codon:yes gene_type:complete
MQFCEMELGGFESSREYLCFGERTPHNNQLASKVTDHSEAKKATYKGSCGCEFIGDFTHTYSTERKGVIHEYELGAGDRKVFFPYN